MTRSSDVPATLLSPDATHTGNQGDPRGDARVTSDQHGRPLLPTKSHTNTLFERKQQREPGRRARSTGRSNACLLHSVRTGDVRVVRAELEAAPSPEQDDRLALRLRRDLLRRVRSRLCSGAVGHFSTPCGMMIGS